VVIRLQYIYMCVAVKLWRCTDWTWAHVWWSDVARIAKIA
jgi:hypothetical protein